MGITGEPEEALETGEPFSMHVQDAFTIKGRGLVVMGSITTGAVKSGDEVELVGARERLRATVIGLMMWGKELTIAKAGEQVGVTLQGIEKDQVRPGMMLQSPRVEPTPVTAEEKPIERRPEVSEVIVPKCAQCQTSFDWKHGYLCQNTPSLTPPPGHGSWGPRVYCPQCGALVAEMAMPWVKEEWEWFGNNRTVNAGCPLPPSPWLYGAFDKGVPRQFAPLYEEHQLDIAKIQQFEREEMKQVESETPENWKEPYEEALSLYRKGELQGALQLIDNAVSVGLPKSKQAQALGGIGIKYVQEKRDVDSAFKCCTRSVELDPSAEWRAHSLLSMVYESEGDQVRAKQAYRDARRFAGTVWWEPDYERQLREIVSRWARNRE